MVRAQLRCVIVLALVAWACALGEKPPECDDWSPSVIDCQLSPEYEVEARYAFSNSVQQADFEIQHEPAGGAEEIISAHACPFIQGKMDCQTPGFWNKTLALLPPEAAAKLVEIMTTWQPGPEPGAFVEAQPGAAAPPECAEWSPDRMECEWGEEAYELECMFDYEYILGANAVCEIEKDAADPAQPDVGVALFVCPIANGTIACDSQYAVGVDDIPAELKGKVLGFLAAWPAGPATIKPPGAGGPPPT